MSKPLLFWLLMFAWAIVALYRPSSTNPKVDRWLGSAPGLLVFLAVLVLAWIALGDPVK